MAWEPAALYRGLKARGILVRHFDKAKIEDYLRITVGSDEECRQLLAALAELLGAAPPAPMP